MIGLVTATPAEAAPFIDRLDLAEQKGGPVPVFAINAPLRLRLAVGGMGKVAAAMACQHLIVTCQAEALINAGICGSLRDGPRWQTGRLYRIETALEADLDIKGRPGVPMACTHWLPDGLPSARLATCDRPVFDPQRRRRLADMADLVDMEGAAVVRVATAFGVPCCLIKGISDNAGPGDRQRLKENLATVSTQVASAVIRALERKEWNR